MKKMLLLALALLLCASWAFAQYPIGGYIDVFADDGYGAPDPLSCQIRDDYGAAYQYLTFHFVHVPQFGHYTTAVEFQADMSEIIFAQDLGDASPWPLKLGTFREGVSISYGICLSGYEGSYGGIGIYLGSNTIKKSSTYRHLCARIRIKNHPIPGIPGAICPLSVGCPSGWLPLNCSAGVVSYDFANCPCYTTTPVEETTWGQIKALYE